MDVHNPKAKFNKGIQLVYSNKTKEVGLSYKNGSVVLLAPYSYISAGYFGNGSLQMPTRDGEDVYFLPFGSVLQKEPSPLTTVSPTDLTEGITIDSIDIAMLSSYNSPLPALVAGRGYGLIYASDASFLKHFQESPVYECVDLSYEPEKKHVTEGHVLFLSMQSILISPLMADQEDWDPVELVSLSSVTAYLPSLPTNASGPFITLSSAALASAAPKSVSKVTFNDPNAVMHRTPSVNPAFVAHQQLAQHAKHPNSGSTSGRTDGCTTGDTMSTGHRAHRQHTAPDTACSSPSHSDRSAVSSPCSSLATSPVATMSTKRPAAVASFNPISGVELLRARVPGPSNVWAETDVRRGAKPLSKSEQAEQQARAAAVKDFMAADWAALENKGFLFNWSLNQLGDQMKSFLLPGKEKFAMLKDCKLIENLECFHTQESLFAHVEANPCLLEPWPKLFARLAQRGWMRAEHRANHNNNNHMHGQGHDQARAGQTIFYYYSHAAAYHMSSVKTGIKAAAKKGLVPSSLDEARAQGMLPGQLLFASRGALMRYVARFPYLLQTPEELADTLHRFNWRSEVDRDDVQRWLWEPTAEDRNNSSPWRFRSTSTDTWVNLAELTRRLWLVPERLFQHVIPALPVAALRQALYLPEQEALAADEEMFSPEVKGVAREDRDKWCTTATNKLAEYLYACKVRRKGNAESAAQQEGTLKKLLTKLNWTEDRCVWSKEWWRNETAWVAPWTYQLVEVGGEPLLGRDFFWTMQHLAEYVAELTTPESQALYPFLYSPLLQCLDCYTPSAVDMRAALRDHANNLVLKLVRNGQGNPFEEGPLKDMLVTTGWDVFGDNVHHVVVFVPHWRTKEVNKDNYRDFESGVDYFDTLDGVQSHLEDHGNQVAQVQVEKKKRTKKAPQTISPSVLEDSDSPPDSPSDDPSDDPSVEPQSSPALSQYSPSEDLVAHLDKRYPRYSYEGQVVEELEKGTHYFPSLWVILKQLGWNTAYQKGNSQGFFVTPWGLQRTMAFHESTSKCRYIRDLTLLRQGVDYFEESKEGKLQLIDYLLKRGLEERIADFDPFLGLHIETSSGAGAKNKRTVPKDSRTISSTATAAAVSTVAKKTPVALTVAITTNTTTNNTTTNNNNNNNSTHSSPASSTGSEGSVFHHLGKTYDVVTPQAQAVIEITEGQRSFYKVFECLKELGWNTAWLNYDTSYIVTSWGFERPGAFEMRGNKPKLMDLSKLREKIDYFANTKQGHNEVFEYLLKRGFKARLEDYNPNDPQNSPGKSPSTTSSASNSAEKDSDAHSSNTSPLSTSSATQAHPGVPIFSAEGVQHGGHFYDAESMEYRIVRLLFANPPNWATIYNHLKIDCQWGSHRVDALDVTLMVAVWALDVPGAFVIDEKAHYQLHDLSVLEENVDYFYETSEGKERMIEYLRMHGIARPTGRTTPDEKNEDREMHIVVDDDDAAKVKSAEQMEETQELAEENEEEVEVEEKEEEEEEQEQSQRQQQESKKRKASTSAASSPQQETRRGGPSESTRHSRHTSSSSAAAQTSSRRCFALDPAIEVCPFFTADWAALRLVLQRGQLVLTTKADAPLQLWLALENINRSWRYIKLSEKKALYVRSSGCNEHSLSKFTEGFDYFWSLKAFWTFVEQQSALHQDAHYLLTEEEKASSRRPRASAKADNHNNNGSSSASVSESSTKQTSRASSVNTAPAASNATAKNNSVDSVNFALKRLDGLTIRKRSPSRSCYRAADPSSNLDRLVAGVSSPAGSGAEGDVDAESSDEESYFQRRNLAVRAEHDANAPGFAKAEYDLDMQEMFCDILQSSPEAHPHHPLTRASTAATATASTNQPDAMDVDDFEDDTDYIPLTQHLHGGEAEPSIVDMLSAAQPPFQRILRQLGWSYQYLGSNRLPNGEPSGGINKVYVRPGRSLQSAGMIKDEDYFLTEESLLDYLRVQYGLQNMPQYVSNTKRPRATRSGRIIDGSEGGTSTSATTSFTSSSRSTTAPRSAQSSPVVTASKTLPALPVLVSKPTTLGAAGDASAVPVGGEKRSRAASSVIAEPADASKRSRRSSSIGSLHSTSNSQDSTSSMTVTDPAPATAVVPVSPLDTYDAVVKALSAASKQSAYRMGPKEDPAEFAAPQGRELEHIQLLSMVASALMQGRGGAAYVCGSPGMGKTHTVVSVLNAVEQDRRNALLDLAKKGDTNSTATAGRKASRSEDTELGYKVIWLSGAGLKSKHDVYAPIASQLGLKPTVYSSLNKGNSKSNRSEAEQIVIERFSSPGEPIELNEIARMKLLGTTTTTEVTTQSGSPERRSHRRKEANSPESAQKGRPRSKPVPMTVLVIDEMDMANKEAVTQLCLLATCAPASLVVIGLGNQVNHVMNLIHVHSAQQVEQVQQLVLPPYNEGKLKAILSGLTGGLFQERAIDFLASKVCKNDKGDVRKMLGYAWLSLMAARSKIASTDDLSGLMVTVKHITEAYGSQKDPKLDLLRNFNGLTLRLLVVLLRLESESSHSSLSLLNILRAFSDYLERKQIPSEAPCIVQDRLNTLLMYSFLRVARLDKRDPNKTMYALDLTVDLMLQMEFAAEHGNLREELLQIKNNQRRREAEDSLAQL